MLPLLCLFVGLAASVNGACVLPFHQVGEGCYYFSLEYDIEKMDWSEARQYCKSMGTDVDLVVMDALCDDYVNLVNYLIMADTFVTLDVMWVGATGSDVSWTWVDGRPLSLASNYWNDTEPSSSGCVSLNVRYFNGWEKFNLYDFSCNSNYHFICQENEIAMH